MPHHETDGVVPASWLRLRHSTVVTALALAALTGTTALPASQAAVPTTPPPVLQKNSAVVTADALPTAQVEGVVWKQVIAGNTVFAGGKFASARPAGAARGTAGVARQNLMSFDIRTGRMTSFAPRLNGQVLALALSPDRRTLYVGGDFTVVNGQPRVGFAAFSVATGALTGLRLNLNNRVNAIVAVNRTVYLGGWFTRVGSTARKRAAAVAATTGVLTAWRPEADGSVNALVATPDRSRIVLGGSFLTLGGRPNPGMGLVTAGVGAVRPWKINTMIKDGGPRTGITALAADGDTVYGSTYGEQAGNFEGVFAANPTDGSVKWLQDCHGDQYGVAPVGNLVYSVGHAHYCRNIGGFGEVAPQRALVVTKAARGTVARNGQPGGHYANWGGKPAPALYNWFPRINIGSASGAGQGAWSVAATSAYVVLGGEFTMVNGRPQQGLVRFTTPGNGAPRRMGPRVGLAPLAVYGHPGGRGLQLGFESNYDQDDTSLSYDVYRDGRRIGTIKRKSTFFRRPWLTFDDTTVSRTGHYRYQVRVRDADGNVATSATITS